MSETLYVRTEKGTAELSSGNVVFQRQDTYYPGHSVDQLLAFNKELMEENEELNEVLDEQDVLLADIRQLLFEDKPHEALRKIIQYHDVAGIDRQEFVGVSNPKMWW